MKFICHMSIRTHGVRRGKILATFAHLWNVEKRVSREWQYVVTLGVDEWRRRDSSQVNGNSKCVVSEMATGFVRCVCVGRTGKSESCRRMKRAPNLTPICMHNIFVGKSHLHKANNQTKYNSTERTNEWMNDLCCNCVYYWGVGFGANPNEL
jgi:hypothetical protein